MKKVIAAVSLFLAGAFISWFILQYKPAPSSPATLIKPRPLDRYTIENLAKREFGGSEIKLEELLSGNSDFTSYLFSFLSDGKKITGQINIPDGEGLFPIIVMFRGWVNQETYQTGEGTRKAAEVFARNGFITVAPDFLGYGGSDKESSNVMEARFQTYTTALNLLASLGNVEQWDQANVFIWGHSNGGQIALTILEISQKSIPAALWAPVSKPFPYSVLYYTDESEDRGKLLRRAIAEFEETYDPNLYSLDLFLDKIQAPLQIHQGTADEAVPRDWSDKLVEKLEELEKDITYFVYLGADHNMQPAWNTVVARDLAFFRKMLK